MPDFQNFRISLFIHDLEYTRTTIVTESSTSTKSEIWDVLTGELLAKSMIWTSSPKTAICENL